MEPTDRELARAKVDLEERLRRVTQDNIRLSNEARDFALGAALITQMKKKVEQTNMSDQKVQPEKASNL
jgi:hypothetical protein